MPKRTSPLSSKPSGGRAEESEPTTTSSPFRDLTKKLLTVPLDKVKAEEAREKKARKAARKKRKAKA